MVPLFRITENLLRVESDVTKVDLAFYYCGMELSDHLLLIRVQHAQRKQVGRSLSIPKVLPPWVIYIMRNDNKYLPHLYDNFGGRIVMQTTTPSEAFSIFGIVKTFIARPYGAFVVTMHARWKGSAQTGRSHIPSFLCHCFTCRCLVLSLW